MIRSHRQSVIISAIIILIGLGLVGYRIISSQSPEEQVLEILETYKKQLTQIPADDSYVPLNASESTEALMQAVDAMNNTFEAFFTEQGYNQFLGNRIAFIYPEYYDATNRALSFDKIDVKSVTFEEELHKAVIIYTLHYHDDIGTTFSEDNQVVFLETDDGWFIDNETINAKRIVLLRYEVENADK